MAVLTFLILLSASPPEILEGIVLDSSGAAISGAKGQLWKKYPFLRAVEQAVFSISPEYFVTPGPRVVQGVRDIRKMIGK